MKNLSKILTPEMEGKNWYREARAFCEGLAVRFDLPIEKVIGVLSALSPGSNWERNKQETAWLLALMRGEKVAKFKFTTYGANVLKAEKIAKSEGDPLVFFNPKTGPKTYYFYLCILYPDNPDYVCIDRHAFAIATGEIYKGLTPKQYAIVAEHYRRHAKKTGLLASELQAILWVDYRKKLEKKNDVPF